MPSSQIAFLDEHGHDNPTNEVAPIVAQEQAKAGDGGTSDGVIAARHLAADIAVGLRNNNWMNLAKCKTMEPDQFFPHDGDGVRKAQRICAICPVKLACLAYALDNRLNDGVWGGTSEQERRWCHVVRSIVR
jgi:WhiB family transcriptional regulator, redox-sensing transcriptional regulator